MSQVQQFPTLSAAFRFAMTIKDGYYVPEYDEILEVWMLRCIETEALWVETN